MHRWNPPSKATVSLDVEVIRDPSYSTGQEWKRAFFESLGIAFVEIGDIKLPISDPRLIAIASRLEEPEVRQHFQLRYCIFSEPTIDSRHAGAWFELSPGPSEFRSPAKVPANRHFAYRDGALLASDKFRECVESNGFTGLDWIPLPEHGDDPMPWFEVFAERPMGRGLDHPLIDPMRLEQRLLKEKFDLRRRWGHQTAWSYDMHADIDTDCHSFLRLRSLVPRSLRVEGPERYVREFLPDTDFAYRHWGFSPDKPGYGYASRPLRLICCNARVRSVLINSGLMKPSWLEAIAILDECDVTETVLDRSVGHPLPPPAYTLEEANIERARRTRPTSIAASARGRFLSTDEALRVLEQRISSGTASWVPAKSNPAFGDFASNPLMKKAPKSWQQLAPLLPMQSPFHEKASDPADERIEFELCEPHWCDWLIDEHDDRDADERPAKNDLVIASTCFGDWYAVRADDPALPADARVAHWDHETSSIASEWPTVAAFVAEIIDSCDRSAGAS